MSSYIAAYPKRNEAKAMIHPIAKLLLIGEKEEELLALEAQLQIGGVEIFRAATQTDAFEYLGANEIALTFIDLQTAATLGFEFAESMRGNQGTRHVPIIFLTTDLSDIRHRFYGDEASSVDFLLMPVEPELLRSKCRTFLDQYRNRQELVLQRIEITEAAKENARLNSEILLLNKSFDERMLQFQKVNDQLQGFTYSVAHDFRRHIRNINTNAQIIIDETGPPDAHLQRILQVSKMMSQMTDDLLSYARMGKAPLHKSEVDISELANEIASGYLLESPSTQFHVANSLTAFGDRTMIRIVLENLLDNAIKYSRASFLPDIEVGQDESGIFVKDNGTGFDMAFVEKAFLPFERLVNDSEVSGTGMGLANVKSIIDRHDGRIWVESKLGAGSTFHFTLPPNRAFVS